MNIPFFTDYLMLSNLLSIGIIAVFVHRLNPHACYSYRIYLHRPCYFTHGGRG